MRSKTPEVTDIWKKAREKGDICNLFFEKWRHHACLSGFCGLADKFSKNYTNFVWSWVVYNTRLTSSSLFLGLEDINQPSSVRRKNSVCVPVYVRCVQKLRQRHDVYEATELAENSFFFIHPFRFQNDSLHTYTPHIGQRYVFADINRRTQEIWAGKFSYFELQRKM